MPRPRGLTLNAAAFRFVLQQRALTQTAVAERSGVALNTISGWLTNTHRAAPPAANAVAAALDVETSVLFPETSGRFSERVGTSA